LNDCRRFVLCYVRRAARLWSADRRSALVQAPRRVGRMVMVPWPVRGAGVGRAESFVRAVMVVRDGHPATTPQVRLVPMCPPVRGPSRLLVFLRGVFLDLSRIVPLEAPGVPTVKSRGVRTGVVRRPRDVNLNVLTVVGSTPFVSRDREDKRCPSGIPLLGAARVAVPLWFRNVTPPRQAPSSRTSDVWGMA